jgi:hypothetical protein
VQGFSDGLLNRAASYQQIEKPAASFKEQRIQFVTLNFETPSEVVGWRRERCADEMARVLFTDCVWGAVRGRVSRKRLRKHSIPSAGRVGGTGDAVGATLRSRP